MKLERRVGSIGHGRKPRFLVGCLDLGLKKERSIETVQDNRTKRRERRVQWRRCMQDWAAGSGARGSRAGASLPLFWESRERDSGKKRKIGRMEVMMWARAEHMGL